jgi:hypothetical protein
MFPFKKTFSKSIEFYMGNLQDDSKFKQLIVAYQDKQTPFPNRFVSDPSVYDQVNLVTDLFTESARMKASVYGTVSPLEYWKINQASIRRFSKERFGDECPFHLRESIYFLTKEATCFSPCISKMLYQTLLPIEGGTVFDPFSGWGDRAIGAIGCPRVTKYVGVDCNPELAEGYKNISSLSDKVNFHQLSISEFKTEETFDLVFTSPPFWDFETYNRDDPKQSIQGIKSYIQWLSEFMTPVLSQLVQLTKPGGYIALYVGPTYRTKTLPSNLLSLLTRLNMGYIQTIECSVKDKRPVPIYVFRK